MNERYSSYYDTFFPSNRESADRISEPQDGCPYYLENVSRFRHSSTVYKGKGLCAEKYTGNIPVSFSYVVDEKSTE